VVTNESESPSAAKVSPVVDVESRTAAARVVMASALRRAEIRVNVLLSTRTSR
jgi:hypothetical protein